MNKYKPDEFGRPPEEFAAQRPDGLADGPAAHEFAAPGEDSAAQEFAAPSEDPALQEFAPVSPEIVAPGTFPWKKRKESKKSAASFGFLTAAMVCVVVLPLLIKGWGGALVRAESSTAMESSDSPHESSGYDGADGRESLEDAEISDQSGESSGSDEASNSSAVESSNSTVDSSTGNSDESDSSETVEGVEPSCELIVFGFYSEIQGSIEFENLDSTTAVSLEIWDILTNSLEETRNITEEVLEKGRYVIEPFYTDFIYENHQEAYNETNGFPMEVEFRVVLHYVLHGEEEEKVVSRQSASVQGGWFVKYNEPESRDYFPYPGIFLFETQSYDEEIEFTYGEPEKVKDQYDIDFSMTIDGKKVSEEYFVIDRYEAF